LHHAVPGAPPRTGPARRSRPLSWWAELLIAMTGVRVRVRARLWPSDHSLGQQRTLVKIRHAANAAKPRSPGPRRVWTIRLRAFCGLVSRRPLYGVVTVPPAPLVSLMGSERSGSRSGLLWYPRRSMPRDKAGAAAGPASVPGCSSAVVVGAGTCCNQQAGADRRRHSACDGRSPIDDERFMAEARGAEAA
jgi:hypothetical protein